MTEEIQKPTPEGQEAPEAPKDEQPEAGNQPDEGSKKLEEALKRERDAREKAEKALAEKAFKQREQSRLKEEDLDPQPEEEKPITAKDLPAILAREREATRKEIMSTEIKRLATQRADSEVERDLIIELHKNRHFPEYLTLEEQLDECFLIANKDKVLGENYELKKAMANRKNVSRDDTGDYQVPQKGSEPRLSAQDSAEYARLGFKFNSTNKRWEKKLANGKTLVKDPKTGMMQAI